MKSKSPKTRFKSVLLIDDSEIDNFINEKIIRASYFAENVYIHTSSKSALEFLKNLQSMQIPPTELIPSYIFLDINMPILDGFHFLDAFEKFLPEFNEKIKVIMLTTSLNPGDISKAKQYKSLVNFLNKPLTEKNLNEIL